MCKKELFITGAAIVMAVMMVMSFPVMGTAGGVVKAADLIVL